MEFYKIVLIGVGCYYIIKEAYDKFSPNSKNYEDFFGNRKVHLDSNNKIKKRLLIDECNVRILKQCESLGLNMSDIMAPSPKLENTEQFNRIAIKIKNEYINKYPKLFQDIYDFDINNL